MKTCKHCKKRVTGPHQCEETGSFVSGLADFIGDALESALSSDGGDSGSDFGGGFD